jgi:hypothetical protein
LLRGGADAFLKSFYAACTCGTKPRLIFSDFVIFVFSTGIRKAERGRTSRQALPDRENIFLA